MLNNNNGISTFCQALKNMNKLVNVTCMKACCGLIKYIQSLSRTAAGKLGGALDVAGSAGGNIVQADALGSVAAQHHGDAADQLVAAVADEHNMIEKERKIDNIRWAELSELTAFDYFDLNAVIAYLVKANMVARWAQLDAKVGREMFNRLVAELDGKEMINKL